MADEPEQTEQGPKYVPLSTPLPPQPMDKYIHNEPPYKLPAQIETFQYKPSITSTFNTVIVKEIIGKVLKEKLEGKTYSPADAAKWSREISDTVNAEVKELRQNPSYKHVVQVMLAQQNGAGCHYVTQCCWDPHTDNLTSDVFTNGSLFCVCTVYGVYLY